jgi:hypothetical protein
MKDSVHQKAKRRWERHGHSGVNGSPEYPIWLRMIDRCKNPNNPRYAVYGGRGIAVCDEWKNSFLAFFTHIGPRPTSKHSLDRINVNGNYEPGNVRWATATEQANNKNTNRRVIYRGREMTVADACRAAGGHIRRETAIRRLNSGWTVENAVETQLLFRRTQKQSSGECRQ